MNGWWIGEVAIQPDHIHILVQASPKNSVSEVVQIFKRGTSRVLRKEYLEIEEFLWAESLKADGYFAETVGQLNEEIVMK